MNDSQALARCVSCLLDSATADATWGDFQAEWDPIITALSCRLLLACGLELDTAWFTHRGIFRECSLRRSFQWLNNSIRPDGTFGTDFWDAAQLGLTIERFSIAPHFTAYASLRKYLLDAIHTQHFLNDESQWQGPGFVAAAIDYCRAVGRERERRDLTKVLQAQCTRDGYWQGQLDPSGAPIVSPVWHTSQCMIALVAAGHDHLPMIQRAAEWLRSTQDRTGAWISVQQFKIYFTAYAVQALLLDSSPANAKHITKGTEYLKSQMSPEGKCSDLGGTLMCAIALRAVVDDHFERDITLADYVLCRQNLRRAEALQARLDEDKSAITALEGRITQYEKKFGDAEIAITKKQLLFITLLGLFLSAVGTVAGVYALGPLFRAGEPHPASIVSPVPSVQPPAVSPASESRKPNKPDVRESGNHLTPKEAAH